MNPVQEITGLRSQLGMNYFTHHSRSRYKEISMSKKLIQIEEIQSIVSRCSEINKLDLSEIIWTENGNELHIDSKIIEAFEYTGLSNMDFITSGLL
jgi:hypothetical protein